MEKRSDPLPEALENYLQQKPYPHERILDPGPNKSHTTGPNWPLIASMAFCILFWVVVIALGVHAFIKVVQ